MIHSVVTYSLMTDRTLILPAAMLILPVTDRLVVYSRVVETVCAAVT